MNESPESNGGRFVFGRRAFLSASLIVVIAAGIGFLTYTLIHRNPASTSSQLFGQVSGFVPYVPKTGDQTDFKLNANSIHFSQGVLLFSLQNPVGNSVSVSEQPLPANYDPANSQVGTSIQTEYGQAYITDGATTIGSLITTDKTWIILNATSPIGADAMQKLIESLSPQT